MSSPDHSPDATESLADRVALGELLQTHRPRLLAMLQWRIDPALAPRLDAEDVLAQVFLVARRRWADFRAQTEMAPYPWLFRLALDSLSEAWRRETRERRDLNREMPLPDRSSIQLGLGVMAPGTSPSQALLRKEVQEQVRLAMAALKPADREILALRHFDQLSSKEVAQILGITVNAVNLRHVRAVGRFKELCGNILDESAS
jgi:RNA polymerase sigma-70 factor (ECF subfamily)